MSKIPPAAASTSGSARISSRTLSGTGARPLEENSSSCLPLTTASVPAYDSLKMLSKAFWKVSVRTYVPLTIAMPSTTARAVSRLRILRPAIPRSVTPIMPPLTSSIASMISRADDCPMSLTIRPSARKSTRSAISAACASCVTMTVVWPRLVTESRSSSRISPLVVESRLPVGSSANMTVGLETRARAIATRCC